MQIVNRGIKRVDKARGKYIWIDGKKLTDFSLCASVNILGHSPKCVQSAIKKQMGNGLSYGLFSKQVEDYTKVASKFIPFSHMAFCNTGSEAVMRAFRFARAFTGKRRIAIFEGCWHGSYDATVFATHPLGNYIEDVLVLPYDLSSIEVLKNYADIAMVFIEPFQGSNPQDKRKLITSLQSYCLTNDILLGFDEIISGVRYPGHKHYGVIPDIATYGKIFGGGLPIGIVAGKEAIMSKDIFLGGTFTGNPMSLSTGHAVLSHIKQEDLDRLNLMSKWLRDKVNKSCINISMIGVGSINRLLFTSKIVRSASHRDTIELSPKVKSHVYNSLFDDGLYLGSNGLVYLSTKHNENDIYSLVDTLCRQDKLLG